MLLEDQTPKYLADITTVYLLFTDTLYVRQMPK